MDWVKIDDKTYRYEDKGVRFFLLLGTEYALLLDSGMQVHNAKELAGELTDLPVKLFNTHTDPDHIGSNEEFDEIMMNPAELVNYHKPHSSQNIIPVYDGDIIGKLIEGAERAEMGGITPEPFEMFGHEVMSYDIGTAVLLCDR